MLCIFLIEFDPSIILNQFEVNLILVNGLLLGLCKLTAQEQSMMLPHCSAVCCLLLLLLLLADPSCKVTCTPVYQYDVQTVQMRVVRILTALMPLVVTAQAIVLFRQQVVLDHSVWMEGDQVEIPTDTETAHMEMEFYTYHDWEIMSVEESVVHFCYIHSVDHETCDSLVQGIHLSVEKDFPHLLSRFKTPPSSFLSELDLTGGTEWESRSGGRLAVARKRVDMGGVSRTAEQEEERQGQGQVSAGRRVFYLLDLMQTSPANMDWILELFPPSLQIQILPPPTPPPLSATADAPDILLVNVASDRQLIQEYLDRYPILILIHLSDEWYGKKHSHAQLTEVRWGGVDEGMNEGKWECVDCCVLPIDTCCLLLVVLLLTGG